MNPTDENVEHIQGSIRKDDIEQEEGNLRYAAYANRIRTILSASHRYVAYTSDIGESFRPVAHPYLVSFGYSVSWMYIIGDVAYATWLTKMKSEGRFTPGLKPWDATPEPNVFAANLFKETKENKLSETDWRLAGFKRLTFQSIASMGLPAFTIHSTVRYSSYLFKNSASKRIKTLGPVALGLAVVPLLPYAFDEPCEIAIDWIFDKGEEFYKKKFD